METNNCIIFDGSYFAKSCWAVYNNNKDNYFNSDYQLVYYAVKMITNIMRFNVTRFDRAAIVFDTDGENFRHKLYPSYKSERSVKEEEYLNQLENLVCALEYIGFNCVRREGIEGDDIIGTLAYHASSLGMNVVIASPDKDMHQLVNDEARVSIFNPKWKSTVTEQEVKIIYDGLTPSQIHEYLALCGDKVDGIPGVNGIGSAKAKQLLKQYKTIDGIMDNLDEIKGATREALKKCDELDIYKILTKIDTEAHIGAHRIDFKFNPFEDNIDEKNHMLDTVGYFYTRHISTF